MHTSAPTIRPQGGSPAPQFCDWGRPGRSTVYQTEYWAGVSCKCGADAGNPLAAALGIYLCDVAPASDSGRDCIRSGKAIVRVVCASAHLRDLGLVINCGRILCRES